MTKTQQGIKTLSDGKAAILIGQDRESHHRDLFENIEMGNFPRWTMYVQIMTQEQATHHPHNPFDLTKVWPHGSYPLIEVGVMELNRTPRTSSRRSSRLPSRRPASFQASAFRRTRCCRQGCSHMEMPQGIDWASTTTSMPRGGSAGFAPPTSREEHSY